MSFGVDPTASGASVWTHCCLGEDGGVTGPVVHEAPFDAREDGGEVDVRAGTGPGPKGGRFDLEAGEEGGVGGALIGTALVPVKVLF